MLILRLSVTRAYLIVEAIVDSLTSLHLIKLVIVPIDNEIRNCEVFKLIIVSLYNEHVDSAPTFAWNDAVVVPINCGLVNAGAGVAELELVVVPVYH